MSCFWPQRVFLVGLIGKLNIFTAQNLLLLFCFYLFFNIFYEGVRFFEHLCLSLPIVSVISRSLILSCNGFALLAHTTRGDWGSNIFGSNPEISVSCSLIIQ